MLSSTELSEISQNSGSCLFLCSFKSSVMLGYLLDSVFSSPRTLLCVPSICAAAHGCVVRASICAAAHGSVVKCELCGSKWHAVVACWKMG